MGAEFAVMARPMIPTPFAHSSTSFKVTQSLLSRTILRVTATPPMVARRK